MITQMPWWLNSPHQRTGRDHQGVPISGGWTPSTEIWEPTASHWTKQLTWLRTALCGGWCLCSPGGAYQKRRSFASHVPLLMAASAFVLGSRCRVLTGITYTVSIFSAVTVPLMQSCRLHTILWLFIVIWTSTQMSTCYYSIASRCVAYFFLFKSVKY